MMTMKLSLLAAFLSIGLVSSQDPTARIRIDSIQVTNVADNPYFDDWSAEINDPYTFSIKTPAKKDLPDSMMMKAVGSYNGELLPELEMSLCEAFDDEDYGKDFLSHGIPNGVFPTACPAKAGNNYEVIKYTVSNSKIPPGIPDGSIIVDLFMYEPDKEPYVTIHFEGALIHELPGLGR